MILLIDNYDSFVYNLYQFIAETGQEVRIVRNDRITPEKVLEMRPDAVVISPGPGKPSDAGICEELIRKKAGEIPILGVCLGHQAIAEAFGAEVVHAGRLMHGKTSLLTEVKDSVLLEGIRGPIQVARYHSLAVWEDTLPEENMSFSFTSSARRGTWVVMCCCPAIRAAARLSPLISTTR